MASLIAIVLATAVGCQERSAQPAFTPKLKADTPEGKLERVIDRLESSLADAQAASGSGVISERSASHRLIRPEAASGPYEAKITIRTSRALAAPADPPANGAVAIGETPDSGEEAQKPAVVAETAKVEENVYSLAYQDDRWTLLTEPKNEIDRLCLEYALKE